MARQWKGKTPKKGDHYIVATEVRMAAGEVAGVVDLVVEHTVLQNGEPFMEAGAIWRALDKEVLNSFREILEFCEIRTEKKAFDRFRQLSHYWKRITKALDRLNKLADEHANRLRDDKVTDE